MLNKKGVGEGISWAVGLIAILIIITFSVIAYSFGKLGEKNPIEVISSSNTNSLELQRITSYALSSDFNSSEKGKVLNSIYLNVEEGVDIGNNYGYAPHSVGILLKNLPVLSLEEYKIIENIGYGLPFSKAIYLPCKNCKSKFVSIGLEVKNVK